MKKFIFAGFVLGVVLGVLPAQASEWKVATSTSKLGFFATQMGAEFEGRFQTFVSRIAFDPSDLANSAVEIQIDIGSVNTQNGERDANIKKPEWFDTASYPQSVFKTTQITEAGDGTYLATAQLTMRGVTKTVELPSSVAIDGATAKAKGELTVQRTDFGIGQGEWAVGTVVGEDVRIFFDLDAVAQ